MSVDGNAKTPKPVENGAADASKFAPKQADPPILQRDEGDRGSGSVTPGGGTPDGKRSIANGQVNRPAPRRRGRRAIRNEEQLERRFDWIQRKVETGELDEKKAAVMIQGCQGLAAVMRYRRDREFEKRLAAVEEKVDRPRKRGADA